jgi:membrane fusion protein (multidrug efflux system)
VATDLLKLRLSVSAAELGRLKIGQPVRLFDPTHAGRGYQGKVARLGVAGDPTTHTFPVEVEVPGGAEGPSPGQVVRATVHVATHAAVLAVPEDAIVKSAVFVVQQGTARRIPVSLGPQVAGLVIVTQGLSPDDEVVIVGSQGLEDGSAVEAVRRSPVIRPQTSAASR